jgi:NAD-dependent dihydropyrimidine dehydrogenase PreA subunit
MGKAIREIIRIDESKCNGCGACVPGCKEGALRIVDGKARLVSEVYCDGLGACLGTCPQGAITIERREAELFDESAVEEHLHARAPTAAPIAPQRKAPMACGCLGSMARSIERKPAAQAPMANAASELRQWPVQLALLHPQAPYLKNADLVLLADCTAVAYADLHAEFLRGRAIAMACPKLDDAGAYVSKLAEMIRANRFRSIEVVMMEVPCCGGLAEILAQAVAMAKVDVPVTQTIISIEGEVKERYALPSDAMAVSLG